MALLDGQLVATMKRAVTGEAVMFDLRPYRPPDAGDVAALEAAALRYGEFLGRPAVLAVS
jgi:hypothetical protein